MRWKNHAVCLAGSVISRINATADESAGCEPCCFWHTEYIQSNYPAAFFSYVTTIRTRRIKNIKPQDPGEPKEPFGLVPHPLLLLLLLLLHIPHPPPVFLWVSFSWSTFSLLFPLSPFPYYSFLPPLSLLSFLAYSPPFPYLLLATPLFSLSLIIWSHKVSILSPRTLDFTPILPLLFCLFYHSAWLTPPPAHTATLPETHTRNVIDRTDKTSAFHSHALPIPPFHINVLTVPPSCPIPQPKDP